MCMKKCIIILALILAGCEDKYRYPCQNPDNWDKDFCHKPICDVNRTCPEHIFKGSDPSKMFEPGATIPENLRNLAPGAPQPAPARPKETGTNGCGTKPVSGVCK
jgi:hypothetical protein